MFFKLDAVITESINKWVSRKRFVLKMAVKRAVDYFRGKKPRALAGGAGKKLREAYAMTIKNKEIAQPSKAFTKAKRAEMAKLANFLAATSGPHAIYYPVRNAVSALNRLPFAYTVESSHPIVCNANSWALLSITEAAFANRVRFSPAFVNFEIDPTHLHSQKFLQALEAWRKENFPDAKMDWYKHAGKIKVGLQAGKKSAEKITGRQMWGKIRASRQLMKALEEWVRKYPLKKK